VKQSLIENAHRMTARATAACAAAFAALLLHCGPYQFEQHQKSLCPYVRCCLLTSFACKGKTVRQ
jgi:hypothetical protein